MCSHLLSLLNEPFWMTYSYNLQNVSGSEAPKRLTEHLRDLQKHKINIYIESTANLKTHLCDLILLAENCLVSASPLLSFDSLWILFIYAWIHHNEKKEKCSITIHLCTPCACVRTQAHIPINTLWFLLRCLCLLRAVWEGWWDSTPARLVCKSGIIIWTQTFHFDS